MIDDPARAERLEPAETFAQVGRLGDEVKVVLQDDIAIQAQALVRLLIAPAVEQNLRAGRVNNGNHSGTVQVRKCGLSGSVTR